MSNNEALERIWVTHSCGGSPFLSEHPKAWPGDVEYVRADIADAAQAEVERLKAELSRTSTETVCHPYKSAIGELASVELERLKAENDNLAVKLAWAESREQNALSRLALRGATGGEPDA
jgi:hypothetical protein